ncbi:MAG: hypothetical protein AAB336_06940 [Acidobacteriota bacterium]
MKICPQCQNTYTDDSLQFCLQDGTQLNFVSSTGDLPNSNWTDEAQTVVRAEHPQMRINLPQQPPPVPPQNYITNPQTNFQPESSGKSKVWIFVLLGLFFLLVIGGIGGVGAWFYFSQGQTTVVQNNTNTGSNSNSVNSNVTNTANANTNANSTPTATPTPKPTLKPAEIETAKKEAESVIYGWKSAAEAHNLDTNLSNYADTVDYYKGGKINKSKLKASKEPAYKRYDSIAIDISNMKVAVDPTGEKATVTFDKEWDFSGTDKDGIEVFNTGKVQQQLVLNKFNGKWKIVSEKDLKVYYADKGSSDDY